MDKQKFNTYCAEVIEIELDSRSACCNNGLSSYKSKHGRRLYNPYNDLNQRIPVFDHLYRQLREQDARELFWDIYKLGIDKATMKFIVSTMK